MYPDIPCNLGELGIAPLSPRPTPLQLASPRFIPCPPSHIYICPRSTPRVPAARAQITTCLAVRALNRAAFLGYHISSASSIMAVVAIVFLFCGAVVLVVLLFVLSTKSLSFRTTRAYIYLFRRQGSWPRPQSKGGNGDGSRVAVGTTARQQWGKTTQQQGTPGARGGGEGVS